MYERKMQPDIRCPLEYGLTLIGGKWKSRILCLLSHNTSMRYVQLRTEMSNITDAVLAATLKELTRDSLILRISYDEIPPHVEYQLTQKGQSFIPILQNICKWSGIYYNKEISTHLTQCERCDYFRP